ncbi:MAG: TOMM precursor leader peptide-binding protein [Planctomycetes bacterium]|nr:TOMM precursor leader peptide-binding protein [Planctomycetota bacterium]
MTFPDLERCHPRLALPFTILRAHGVVRLVAGEDFRYTLHEEGIEGWLPELLARCDGTRTAAEALAGVEPVRRDRARQAVERLWGERVLVEADVSLSHRGGRRDVRVEGASPLRARVEDALRRARVEGPTAGSGALLVFCQDALDYDAALEAGRRSRAEGTPFLWATTGPMHRAFAGPVFLPRAGPCLTCLYRHFLRLSPCPEIYAGLLEHVRGGGKLQATEFPAAGLDLLAALVAWKVARFEAEEAQTAPYRLHVAEVDSLEVSAYPVFSDPECPDCRGGRA